jgi:hypothetical protein
MASELTGIDRSTLYGDVQNLLTHGLSISIPPLY